MAAARPRDAAPGRSSTSATRQRPRRAPGADARTVRPCRLRRRGAVVARRRADGHAAPPGGADRAAQRARAGDRRDAADALRPRHLRGARPLARGPRLAAAQRRTRDPGRRVAHRLSPVRRRHPRLRRRAPRRRGRARGAWSPSAGAAQPASRSRPTYPALSATDAMRRLMDDVGVRRAVRVVSGPAGPARRDALRQRRDRRAGRLRRGHERAARVAARPARRPAARYTAVVDAATGRDPVPRQPRQVRGQRRAGVGAVPGRRERRHGRTRST